MDWMYLLQSSYGEALVPQNVAVVGDEAFKEG